MLPLRYNVDLKIIKQSNRYNVFSILQLISRGPLFKLSFFWHCTIEKFYFPNFGHKLRLNSEQHLVPFESLESSETAELMETPD